MLFYKKTYFSHQVRLSLIKKIRSYHHAMIIPIRQDGLPLDRVISSWKIDYDEFLLLKVLKT